MFAIVVVGKTGRVVGIGSSEENAVRMLDRSRIAFASRNACCLNDLHHYFISRNSKWYLKSKLITPHHTTEKCGRFTVTTFP